MIAPEPISEAEVVRLLNTAVEENRFIVMTTWTDAQIAEDLCRYAPGLENVAEDNEELLAGIAAWRKQLKEP